MSLQSGKCFFQTTTTAWEMYTTVLQGQGETPRCSNVQSILLEIVSGRWGKSCSVPCLAGHEYASRAVLALAGVGCLS